MKPTHGALLGLLVSMMTPTLAAGQADTLNFMARTEALMQAMARGDRSFLDSILAPEFEATFVEPDGVAIHMPRWTWLRRLQGELQTTKPPRWRLLTKDLGHAVVVWYTYDETSTYPPHSAQFVYTDFWIRDDSEWKLAWRSQGAR